MSRRRSTNLARAAALAASAAWLAGCSSAPSQPATESPAAVPAAQDTAQVARPLPERVAIAQPAAAAGVGSPIFPAAALPPRASADFDRAVALARAGNVTEAELEFRQLAEAYPELAAPYVNLGLLYRKAGQLDRSEEALTTATARNPSSAGAWTELGVTRRMRGHFRESADAYEHAIAADDNYAPAHRNLAVLLDLYLEDPERALSEFERYKALTGEEKPVNGWIAELRQRTRKKVPPAPGKAQAQDAAPSAEEGPAPPGPVNAPPPSSGA